MPKFICFLLLCFISSSAISQESPAKKDNMIYYGKESFLIEGTGVAESEKESPYDRLPASYKDKVRKPVWDLSKNSAGISLRFNSNSSLEAFVYCRNKFNDLFAIFSVEFLTFIEYLV